MLRYNYIYIMYTDHFNQQTCMCGTSSVMDFTVTFTLVMPSIKSYPHACFIQKCLNSKKYNFRLR